MKKGLFIFLAIAILFGMIACSEEMPIVQVSSLTLKNEVIYVSSSVVNSGIYDNNYFIEASSILPEDAADKTLKFTLVDGQLGDLEEHTWSEFVTVDELTGKVSFKVPESGLTKDQIKTVHDDFEVAVTAASGVSATCTFKFNYEAPTEIVLSANGGVFDATNKIVDLITVDGYKATVLSYGFTEDLCPTVVFTEGETPLTQDATNPDLYKDANKIVSINTKTNTITALTSGSVTLTVTSTETVVPEEGESYQASGTFTIYVNRITSEEELKIFLGDVNAVAVNEVVSTRNDLIAKAKYGYLTDNLTVHDLKLMSGATKYLNLNGKNVTFVSDGSNGTAVDLSEMTGTLTITASGSTVSYIRANTLDAKMFAGKKLTIIGGTFNVEGDNATVLDSVGGTTLTSVTFNSTGKSSAKAIEGTGLVSVTNDKCKFEATATAGDAIAITLNNAESSLSMSSSVKTPNVTATATAGDATGIKVDAAATVNATVKATATAGKAVGVQASAGTFEVSATVTGKTAYGLVNTGNLTVNNSTFTVTGTKTADIANEFCDYATAGIVNKSTLNINSGLTIEVGNTSDSTTTKDIYGIYNSGTATIKGTSASDKAKVTVTVNVDKGGAYALRNLGSVTLENLKETTFTANRGSISNGTQADVFGVYSKADLEVDPENNTVVPEGVLENEATSLLTIKNSDVRFEATSLEPVKNVRNFIYYLSSYVNMPTATNELVVFE